MSFLPRNARADLFLCATLVIQLLLSFALALFPRLAAAGYLGQTLLLYLFSYGAPIPLFLHLARWDAREVFPLPSLRLKNLLLALALALAVQPLMSFLSAFGLLFTANRAAEVLNQAAMPWGQAVIALALLPALCEELVYRGIVFSGFRNTSLKTAVLMNALLFGLMHLNLQQFFYAFAMGLVFALLRYRTGSIFYPFVCHAGINTLQISAYYLTLAQSAGQVPDASATPEAVGPLLLASALPAVLSLALTLFLLYLVRRANPPAPSTGPASEVALDHHPLPGTAERVLHPSLGALLFAFAVFSFLLS